MTTTTTTTFSMTRNMAKAMCQHFMNARLIENAADLGDNLFKIANSMNSDPSASCTRLSTNIHQSITLGASSADDEVVIVTQSVITPLFCRFFGRQPNYLSTNPSASSASASTATLYSTGTSKGQIHVMLISVRGLNVTFVRSRPYVIVQFKQNEFVSREPTDEMDEEVTNVTFRLIILGFMLVNKWLDDHTFSNKTRHTICKLSVQSLNKLEFYNKTRPPMMALPPPPCQPPPSSTMMSPPFIPDRRLPPSSLPLHGEVTRIHSSFAKILKGSLSAFASEVARVALEVGTQGILGGQARVEGVQGAWADLTRNVNKMTSNLTDRVRSISEVTKAVTLGDLCKFVNVDVQGEMLDLKMTVHSMYRRYLMQAYVPDVLGMWKVLTLDNVNIMAMNWTSQAGGNEVTRVAREKDDWDVRLLIPKFFTQFSCLKRNPPLAMYAASTGSASPISAKSDIICKRSQPDACAQRSSLTDPPRASNAAGALPETFSQIQTPSTSSGVSCHPTWSPSPILAPDSTAQPLPWVVPSWFPQPESV
ncbi:hypothetical protein EDD22DRAFT_986577, partial [Suillus occidentalis]